MRNACRFGLLVAIMLLASVALVACGGGDDENGSGASTTMKNGTTVQSQTTAQSATTEANTETSAGAPAETEVTGMPDGFPSDVPIHPGTVTAYEPMEVTDTTTIHQLTVQTTASYGAVLDWYQSELPAGWSVGFFEDEDGEAKIALNGGDYTSANSDGNGGGVLIGVMDGSKTTFVVTVAVVGK